MTAALTHHTRTGQARAGHPAPHAGATINAALTHHTPPAKPAPAIRHLTPEPR